MKTPYLVSSESPVLRSVAAPVSDIAEQVLPHIEGMKSIMARNEGVGLAAPQVGLSLRFFLFGKGKVAVVINPLILAAHDFRDMEEGCLSFPGQKAIVRRAHKIDVTYQNETGERVEKTLNGLYAVIFQHETDHLNGICIIP